MTDLQALARDAKAWPFQEARAVLKRIERDGVGEKGYVLFETGYGPSGLPHLGTFGEVARTTMVMRALQVLAPDLPAKLICFSDDMDGLRKVPGNVPQQDMMAQHLDKPLTAVPDPFETHDSFGAHNNARLRAFLDRFGLESDFYSATACYRSGLMDATLLKILAHYDEVIQIVLPTLGEERQKTYCPFLPISPSTGKVLQGALQGRDPEAGTVTFEDEDGTPFTVPVTGGHVKCQWKVDWAMRWVALGVDYEMAGKDLIESVKLSSRIAQVLGHRPPDGFSYELFVDDRGEKISKSKGNGIAIEDWLRYANQESLALYMFQSPRKAKKLYFDVIPKAVDEYYTHLSKFHGQEPEKQLENPAFHIHGGSPPRVDMPVSFALLLNLVSAAHTDDKAKLWGYVARYAPGASPDNHPELDALMGYAVVYFHDFVAPTKQYRLPTAQEMAGMTDLAQRLRALPDDADGETIQNEVFAAGKTAGFDNLRDWFKALYEVLLGQSHGPRMGGFIALYGRESTLDLIDTVLSGQALGPTAETSEA